MFGGQGHRPLVRQRCWLPSPGPPWCCCGPFWTYPQDTLPGRLIPSPGLPTSTWNPQATSPVQPPPGIAPVWSPAWGPSWLAWTHGLPPTAAGPSGPPVSEMGLVHAGCTSQSRGVFANACFSDRQTPSPFDISYVYLSSLPPSHHSTACLLAPESPSRGPYPSLIWLSERFREMQIGPGHPLFLAPHLFWG